MKRDPGLCPDGGACPCGAAPYKSAVYLESAPPPSRPSRRRRLWASGNPRAALADLSASAEAHPCCARLRGELGEMLRDLLRRSEAFAAFDRAVALQPSSGRLRALRGRARSNERVPGAGSDLDEAARLEPGCGWIRSWRGEFLRREGRLEEALRELDHGLALDPGYARALCWRGAVKAALGLPREAVADLDEAIGRDGSYALAYAERARARFRLGDHDRAFDDMRRAARLDAQFTWVPGRPSAAALQPGSPWRAWIEDLRLAAAKSPSPWPFAWRGELWLRLRRAEEAVADLTAALERDPACAWALAWRGEAYRQQGRWEAARADLDAAVSLDPDYCCAWAWRGLLRLDRGRPEDALRDLDRAGDVQEGLKKRLAANAAPGSAPRLASPASWILGARGRALLELGRSAEAAEALERAVRLDAGYKEARLHLARALKSLGRARDSWDILRTLR